MADDRVTISAAADAAAQGALGQWAAAGQITAGFNHAAAEVPGWSMESLDFALRFSHEGLAASEVLRVVALRQSALDAVLRAIEGSTDAVVSPDARNAILRELSDHDAVLQALQLYIGAARARFNAGTDAERAAFSNRDRLVQLPESWRASQRRLEGLRDRWLERSGEGKKSAAQAVGGFILAALGSFALRSAFSGRKK